MGDIIYPGVQLYRVHDTTEDIVRGVLYEIIGSDPRLYEEHTPHVTILRERNQSLVNIVISGILLPLNEIRRRTALKRIGDSVIRIYGVDFGADRKDDGLHSHRFQKLHEKLSRGQGFGLNPLKIINGDFMNFQFGGWRKPTSTVRFMANLRTSRIHNNAETVRAMLKEPGEFLYYWNTPRDNSSIEIRYVYVIDAVQAIMRLNQNPRFFLPITSFFTESACRYSGKDFLGTENQPLNATQLMTTIRYIPVESVQRRVIDANSFTKFATICSCCSNPFQLIGYSADLTWFAANCLCIEANSLITWKDENFIRLIVNPEVEKAWERNEDLRINDKPILIQFLKGLTPLFEDVDEYFRSGHAAAILEFRKQKDDLAKYHSQLGTIVSSTCVDIAGEGGTRDLKLTIRTKRTSNWCEERQSNIDRAVLIPPRHGYYFLDSIKPTVESDEQNIKKWMSQRPGNNECTGISEEDIRDEHLAADNQRLSGKVYEILDYQLDPEYVTVTAVVTVEAKENVNPGTKYYIIPKPPDIQIVALKSLVSDWFTEESSRQHQIMSGLVVAADMEGEVPFISLFNPTPIWVVKVLLRQPGNLSFHQNSMLEMYYGCDLYLKVRNVGDGMFGSIKIVKRTGRVLAADLIGGRLFLEIAVLLEPTWEVVVLEGAVHPMEPDNVQFRLWAIREKRPAAENIVNVVIRHNNDQQNRDPEDDWLSENDEDEENDEEIVNVFVLPALPPPTCLTVYERVRPPTLQYNSLHDIATYWEERPVGIDCTFLDFFLKKTKDYILHPLEIGIEFSDTGNGLLIDEINGRLNDSQRHVIQNMLTRPLSVAIGPPGTGKSTTAAYGILWLYLAHGGTIVVSAPSNFAAQVLYEKLISYKRELGMEVEIFRMLSRSRERANMRRNPDLETNDPNYLHIRTRRFPAFVRNLREFRTLLARSDRDGFASLTTIEKRSLQDYMKFQDVKKLELADIVVCTVGCASDTRLATLKKNFLKMGKRFSGLVVDEASLLTVPDTLPILTLLSPPARVWLLGDPNQLPPTITSESADHAGLNISWMEFVQLTPLVRDLKEGVFSLLNIQYRMATEIGTVVSRFLYDGRVLPSESVTGRRYFNMPRYHDLLENFPELRDHNIGLYTYNGHHEQRVMGSSSLWNDHEVQVTEELLRSLFFCNINMSNVVVIAMYSLQVKKLTERVRRMGPNYRDVVVASVDSYQGKEAPIIIINTVRSNLDRQIGFLREERRLNVAVSRAIDYLLFVCDKDTLMGAGIPNINRLFGFIEDEGVQDTPV